MSQGKVGSFSRNEERARVPGHGPIVLASTVKANNGIYLTGMLVTLLAAELIPLVVASGEVIETGDGNTKAFTGTLAAFPVEPGTLAITDGIDTFTDDGCGRLTGSAGGTGTINYKTGAYSLTFNANVVLATDVTADYVTAFDGVLDTQVDTTVEGSGIRVVHGTVDRTVLKIGKTDPVEPSAAVLAIVQAHGVYPI
ncbi:MAG: hypothetical protein A2076_13150 [Geobacteraceae bacterium GWC2_53_11]|nr:MAG: hypothetical protein A2076_13150 [Geobacteraceae bacterium GWC2_53_11]